MNMKHLLTYILLLCSLAAAAQISSADRQYLGERDLTGTSRYVAMGGAMAAVGGDASAASDNPAGLGLYRRSELMITLDYQINNSSLGQRSASFSCGQTSWNFCFLQDQIAGICSNNIMLNYRRLKNFHREYGTRLVNMDHSQTDVMALKTNGLIEKDLEGEEAWNNADIGWLSKMGYEGYLIDPDSINTDTWMSANLNPVNGDLTVQESGSIDEFTIGWGMNISNQWYVGAELGARSLTYMKSSYYDEYFSDGGWYKLKSYVSTSGVGFVSKVGLIYRPSKVFRIGAAFHSPVPMAITMHNTADFSTNNRMQVSFPLPEYSNSPNGFTQPMRAVAGLAWQIQTKGLISLEYDYQHDLDKAVFDTHQAKLGLEGVIANNWFLNAGYSFKFRQLQNKTWADPIREIDNNTTRTDTEITNFLCAHYFSAGVSFRHKYVVVGAAYQCRLNGESLRFHELQTNPIDLRTISHRMVLSLSWRR